MAIITLTERQWKIEYIELLKSIDNAQLNLNEVHSVVDLASIIWCIYIYLCMHMYDWTLCVYLADCVFPQWQAHSLCFCLHVFSLLLVFFLRSFRQYFYVSHVTVFRWLAELLIVVVFIFRFDRLFVWTVCVAWHIYKHTMYSKPTKKHRFKYRIYRELICTQTTNGILCMLHYLWLFFFQ